MSESPIGTEALTEVRRAIVTREVTCYQLAKASGVPATTVYNVCGEDHDPRDSTVAALFAALESIRNPIKQ